MRSLFLWLFIFTPFLAQAPFSIKAKAGLFFDDPKEYPGGSGFVNRYSFLDESRPYTVGAGGEVFLPHRLSFGADALYKRMGYTEETSDRVGSVYDLRRARANSWEFPIYGRFSFAARESKLRPYAGGGYSVRWLQYEADVWHVALNYLPGCNLCYNSTTSHESLPAETSNGFHLQGGVELRAFKYELLLGIGF